MDNDKFQELVLQQFQAMDKQFQAITDELKNLNDGQSRIENRMDRLETKVDKLELRIENEVIDKIRILFDADKVREEKLSQVVEKLDSIEIDTGYLVSRVSRLEKVAK